ncbi:P63C domain-containing protein [uncultured Parasutterella sp.]|uniref:P63C domain-containing protein n=1 Tax=uncultured Parasutterella sp. TaxID=1263098 RepID=UPI002596D73A|nr:P63C domain-containing protein [uncultured Parasutterella sp.]
MSRVNSGRAANAKRTPEERKALAQKMVCAKKELAKYPKATHQGVLKIGDLEIPCAVLEDGTRVLTQSNFMEAMGMYYSGWISKNESSLTGIIPAEVPHFLAQKSLIPYINKHLSHLQNIIYKYRTEGGTVANGIKAEIIPSICEIYLDADMAGVLGKRQKLIAKQAMIMIRAFAHVGIVALVDEATGYQKERERDALAKILEAFVAKELQPYMKTFDPEYYAEMFRLRGLDYPPKENPNFRPQYFGKLTNDIVYDRLAPGVKEALKNEAKKIKKSHKLFQHLTADIGRQELIKHLGLCLGLMKISDNWEQFTERLDKVKPSFNQLIHKEK